MKHYTVPIFLALSVAACSSTPKPEPQVVVKTEYVVVHDKPQIVYVPQTQVIVESPTWFTDRSGHAYYINSSGYRVYR